jgi:GNAT superfamily N-acetyltransferase
MTPIEVDKRPAPTDLALLERWLSGWSLARGLPLPQRQGGGLVVEVGRPDQLRRHVFVDAGAALRDCAGSIRQPLILLKAAVTPEVLRAALPARWQIESPRTLMHHDGPLPAAPVPEGYAAVSAREFGATLIRFLDADGALAASGKLVVHGRCAVFDQIETAPAHRRRGLGRALMAALDQVARQANAGERLLVATDEGRMLYLQLGWVVMAPYSTAVLPAILAGGLSFDVADGVLRW